MMSDKVQKWIAIALCVFSLSMTTTLASANVSDNPVVDLSDESIQKISEGVAYALTSRTFTCDYAISHYKYTGLTYYFPSAFISDYYVTITDETYSNIGGMVYAREVTESGPPVIQHYPDSTWKWKFQINDGSNTNSYVKSFGSLPQVVSDISFGVNTTSSQSFSQDETITDFIYFSNYDVYDTDGNLIHAADVEGPGSSEPDPEPEPEYTISFVTGFEDLTVPSVSSKDFVAPSVSYDGYTFVAWYLDSGFTAQYTSDYTFTANTTLYAKWVSNTPDPDPELEPDPEPEVEYQISFVTGFEDLTYQNMSSKDFVAPVPSYEGYSFAGWYLDEECTVKYSSAHVFTEDTTLYAKWIDISELPMGAFHSSIFDAFGIWFSSEPMVYILAIVGLLVILGLGKSFIASRL